MAIRVGFNFVTQFNFRKFSFPDCENKSMLLVRITRPSPHQGLSQPAVHQFIANISSDCVQSLFCTQQSIENESRGVLLFYGLLACGIQSTENEENGSSMLTTLKCNRLERLLHPQGEKAKWVVKRLFHLSINMYDGIINLCYDNMKTTLST